MVRALSRAGALRRRGGGGGRGRGQVDGAQGGRPGRCRLRGAARRARPRGGDEARVAAGRARLGRQHPGDPRLPDRRRRQGVRGGRRHRQRRRQHAALHRRRHRAARLRGELRPLRRSADLLGVDPEPASHAGLSGRDAGHARDHHPRHPAARRRRLRAQNPHLPGGAAARLPGAEAGAAHQVDRGAHREPARRRPRPRGAPLLRGRVQEGRHRHRAASQGDRRRRRALGALRLGPVLRHLLLHPDLLQDSEQPRAAVLGGDQQVPVERLPGLRQGGGVVPDGPHHGRGRQGDGSRPGGRAAQELHPARGVPLLAGLGRDARQRQLPEGAQARPRDDRLRELPEDAGGGARAGALHRPGHRPGADPRGLLDAALDAAVRATTAPPSG